MTSICHETTVGDVAQPHKMVLELSTPHELSEGIIEIDIRTFGFVDAKLIKGCFSSQAIDAKSNLVFVVFSKR